MVEPERDFLATVDSAIAQNVKRARERAGMSQSEMATRLTDMGLPGVHQTTIARIESGQRVLRIAEALAIARMLDYRVEELVESTGSAGLRAEYDDLEKSVTAFWNAGQGLFHTRLMTAMSLDRQFPYGPGGMPSEGDVLAVNPSIYDMVDELLSTNSEPLERVRTMYPDWRAEAGVFLVPFKRTRLMDLYEELISDGYGALKQRDRTRATDKEFDDEVAARFFGDADDVEHQEEA